MTDKELIRRALLGSREAQQECTEKGIVLPCACCGRIVDWDFESGMVCHGYTDCILGGKMVPLSQWNTRPAPPVGRCKDCFQYHSEGPGVGYCSLDDQGREETNFCSEFEPKEE